MALSSDIYFTFGECDALSLEMSARQVMCKIHGVHKK